MNRYIHLTFLLLLSPLILNIGCGKTKKPPEYRRPEMSRPTEEAPAENKVAQALVDKGVRHLNENNLRSAEWNFEEAIRLFSAYGPAYYWLAQTKWIKGDKKRALNLLDRAELLLRNDSTWTDKIDQLKNEISTGYSSPTERRTLGQ